MHGISRSWSALGALFPALFLLMFIGWAPAPEGFILAAVTALGWCRWAEAHLHG